MTLTSLLARRLRTSERFTVVLALLAVSCQASVRNEPAPQRVQPVPYVQDVATQVELVSTAVPWPRGIVWRDGKLYALARGVHRSAGGPNPEIEDLAGTIFEIDPDVSEPVVPGQPPGEAVRTNARVVAEPTEPPFRLWDRRTPATRDTHTDRPYAGLLHDPPSQNFFVIGFAGIDLAGSPSFRKNPTDAVHRYHAPTGRWHVFESHDPATVPDDELAQWLPNEAFPHGDPAKTAPPHGLPNGACGGAIVGRYLYVTAKDNSALIQYPLDEIRRDPEAGPPQGRYIFHRSGPADDKFLQTRKHGKIYVEGTCAVDAFDGYLYVAFRTTSQVVRFPITEDGDVVRPIVADYLAQFDAYEREGDAYTKSADIFDLRINSRGECFVSCNGYGCVWKIPTDGSRVLDGSRGTGEKPYVNLRELTDHDKSTAGNFCTDPDGNLYICTGNWEVPENKARGAIYKVRPPK